MRFAGFLGCEFFDEGADEFFSGGEGAFGGEFVHVGDVPVADFVGGFGEVALEEGTVFGIAEGDDEVGCCEIVGADLFFIDGCVVNADAALGEGGDNVR